MLTLKSYIVTKDTPGVALNDGSRRLKRWCRALRSLDTELASVSGSHKPHWFILWSFALNYDLIHLIICGLIYLTWHPVLQKLSKIAHWSWFPISMLHVDFPICFSKLSSWVLMSLLPTLLVPSCHRCSVHGPDSTFSTPSVTPVLMFQAVAKVPGLPENSLWLLKLHPYRLLVWVLVGLQSLCG